MIEIVEIHQRTPQWYAASPSRCCSGRDQTYSVPDLGLGAAFPRPTTRPDIIRCVPRPATHASAIQKPAVVHGYVFSSAAEAGKGLKQ